MVQHEYSLVGGVNRAQIGRYIGIAAATISAGIVFLLLSFVDLARSLNIPVSLPPSVLSLAGAGTVFAILYWLFERYVWRWSAIRKLLKVPDLAGHWKCSGKTLDSSGNVTYTWDATVTILQSWDKIRVRLVTAQSGSNSISAALFYDDIEGYHLLYNYRNDPNVGETALASHVGFSSMIFSKEQNLAVGDYFNGHGRFTFGTMNWEKT